ncbi:MAG: 50S ribosomal protein L32 [Candidatus Auribacterota bacterium]|jgi:large subunit ribosomal protein L32|uniref:Large ribosomal subunit protein bL32 n=1 Tax=Candidatus Auribacter fodinae TaxID=2093366 RepID=A0A3A4R4U5_9BACT|nr:MAG: 50S ribosomal protein L32 [Candidatus Auribacter fodinae]
MANPKKRMSKCRTHTRRSHDRLDMPAVVSCDNCGQPKLPHRICPECGYYGKKQIVEVEEGV